MEIRNNAEALRAFLGVSSPASAAVEQGSSTASRRPAFPGDEVTLSHIGAEVSQSAGEAVRMEKVAAIQQALAAGTYQVPAAEVADKVMQTMLSVGIVRGK